MSPNLDLAFQLLPLQLWKTVYMVGIATVFSLIFGLPIGVVLTATSKGHIKENVFLYKILETAVNIGRSFPFAILMITLIPFTRWLLGTSLGTTASIVPLTIAAVPFVARLVELSLQGVDYAILEAAIVMGSNTWQIIKVLLQEALSSIVSGITLTIVNLIGYSAMAGLVGGGGLGQIAIQYGYHRFNTGMMVMTVILLILLVQGVQWMGNLVVRLILKKEGDHSVSSCFYILASVFLFVLSSCSNSTADFKVAVTPQPHAQMLELIQPDLKAQGINLVLVVTDDYNMPNRALANGEVDANFFQHIPFMEEQIRQFDYPITSLVKVEIEPMGIYSKKIASLLELQENATIAIPNDPTNEARALILFQKQGLIQLDDANHLQATVLNIIDNPKRIKFIEIDAAMLPRSMEDVDAVAINTNYALEANLSPLKDALVLESEDSSYVNIVVIRRGDENRPEIEALKAAMTSEKMREFILNKYQGAIIPAF